MRAGEVPLEVSARVSCRWRDGEFHPARVVERRKRNPEKGGGALLGDTTYFEYYVHYEKCARRDGGVCAAEPVSDGAVPLPVP